MCVASLTPSPCACLTYDAYATNTSHTHVTHAHRTRRSGDITLSDVDLAAASGGLVLGFNLEPNDVVLTHAKRQGVQIMTYKVGDVGGKGTALC